MSPSKRKSSASPFTGRWQAAFKQLDIAGPFACDPGREQTRWWLGLPLVLLVALVVINAAAPMFYRDWILPEGYGFLEVGHFFIPLAGALIALKLLFHPYVRRRRLLFWYVAVMGLGCFYIAGEEHSWGQHFFHWTTPGYWAEINRQHETNLHNVSPLFNQFPRTVLEIAIVTGGLVLPFLAWRGVFGRRGRLALFVPPATLAPIAIGMLFFKLSATLEKNNIFADIVQRPAEATETYIYLFLLAYLIVLARRIASSKGVVEPFTTTRRLPAWRAPR